MNNEFESARCIGNILLGKYDRKKITYEIIKEEVNEIYKLRNFKNVNRKDLIEILESDYRINTPSANVLVAKNVRPWLNDYKSKIDFELWERYKNFIVRKDPSFPINSIDDVTDKILDKCVNPKIQGRWDRRGMVVGNVQSGKTANYIGLINKAADAGYKLIIVIAGVHNSLRKQTQQRLDEGFIGRDSSDYILKHKNKIIGVGRCKTKREIYSFTSSEIKGDFNRNIATKINVPITGQSPNILVIKKNKNILENLILWLYSFAIDDNGEKKIFDVPLLVIDDEADNASVNSGTELDVKTINRLIRTLLNLFNQNTFIGYTATPFANIFIPSEWSDSLSTMVKDVKLKVGEDLFPRDFIVNIPPPSNYIGAVQLFGYENNQLGEEHEGLDIIRYAEDQEPFFPKKINKKNKENLPNNIPHSLKLAIKSFILTCAIRKLRGQEKNNNSMLVHVSLYVAWIDRIAYLVNEILRDYKRQIHSKQGPLLKELQTIYKYDYLPTTKSVIENISYKDPRLKNFCWTDIESVLDDTVSKIEVRAVHGTKNIRHLEYHRIEDLNYDEYENGLSVIAVGGNRLSRGITLQGLSISYYLRTTRLYDSLMQMGRWFGYKPGYVDLCRLFTTEQLVNWYRYITLASEELRDDLDVMVAHNKQPIDYKLKVRIHPSINAINRLSITSAAKMKEHDIIKVGYSGITLQTFIFKKSKDIAISNFRVFNQLLAKLKQPSYRKNSSLIWNNIASVNIIDFLLEFQQDYHNFDMLCNYVRQQNSNNLLNNWNVALLLNSNKNVTANVKFKGKQTILYPFEINGKKEYGGLPVRSLGGGYDKDKKELSVNGQKNAILYKGARMIDLDINDNSPSEQTIKERRNKLQVPLLVIMPMDPRVSDVLDENIPLIGFGVIIPEFENEEKVEFAVRKLDVDTEYSQIDDDIDDDER